MCLVIHNLEVDKDDKSEKMKMNNNLENASKCQIWYLLTWWILKLRDLLYKITQSENVGGEKLRGGFIL